LLLRREQSLYPLVSALQLTGMPDNLHRQGQDLLGYDILTRWSGGSAVVS